jgi:hypothetical protein
MKNDQYGSLNRHKGTAEQRGAEDDARTER